MPRPEERDFAGFRVIRPLLLGERASVWAAEDPETGAPVAIETLAGEAAGDEDVTEWFAEAWELVAGLDRRGIVSVVRLGEQDGVPFAIRAPLGESTLADRLERGGPLSAGAALQVLGEVGGALEAAHEAGVVHGALEPGCVVLDEHGRAHLAGFGRREGDRREDVRALGSLLVAMLGEAGGAATAAPESSVGADASAADRAGERDQPSGWELDRAEVLRGVASAGAAGEYARAADLVSAARAARPARAEGDGSANRWRLALALLALVAAAVIIAALVFGGGEDGDGAGSSAPQDTSSAPASAPAPATGPPRPIPVRGFPVAAAASDGVVYAVTRDGGSLDGFDEETGVRVFGPVDLGGEGHDLSVADGTVWATAGSTLAAVDLGASEPAVTAVAAGEEPGPLLVARNSVWVLDEGSGELLRFAARPSAEAEPEATKLDAAEPTDVAFGHGSLWVSDGAGGMLRVDPDDPGEQKAFEVGGSPASVLAAGGWIWFADAASGSVIALDPKGGAGPEFAVGGEPRDLAADAEHLWIANADGYVSAIDLATGELAPIDLSGAGGSPQGLAVGTQVWAAMGAGNTLVAIAAAAR